MCKGLEEVQKPSFVCSHVTIFAMDELPAQLFSGHTGDLARRGNLLPEQANSLHVVRMLFYFGPRNLLTGIEKCFFLFSFFFFFFFFFF